MPDDFETDAEWQKVLDTLRQHAGEKRSEVYQHDPLVVRLVAARKADAKRYRAEWLPRLANLDLPKVHSMSAADLTKVASIYPPTGRVSHFFNMMKFTAVSAERLAKKKALSLVEDLHFARRVESGAYEALFSSKHLVNLKKIHVIRESFNDKAMTTLLANEATTGPRELHLHGNDVTDVGLAALLASDKTRELEVLDLSYNSLSKRAFEGLGDGAALPRLRELSVDGNEIGDGAVARIASAGGLGALQTVNLKYTDVDTATLLGFFDADRFPALKELRILDTCVDEALQSAAKARGVRLYLH